MHFREFEFDPGINTGKRAGNREVFEFLTAREKRGGEFAHVTCSRVTSLARSYVKKNVILDQERSQESVTRVSARRNARVST